MIEQDERYLNQLGKMERPIPGESLTNDPENPQPHEGPPEFTKKKDALEAIFANLTREEVYVPAMEALIQGTPVMEMTQVLLFEGFRQGKWNPDLFMMLVEPTAYMTMALAERAQVEYVIDREGDEVDPDNEIEKKFDTIGKTLMKGAKKPDVLPPEIEQKIEELPAESLIQKPQEQAATEPQESIIKRRV